MQIANIYIATPAQREWIQTQHLQHKAYGAAPEGDNDPAEGNGKQKQ